MILRRYEPADHAALNALKLRAFASGFERMRPDFWQWQYSDNPAGPASGLVAVDGSSVAGFVGVVPRRLKLGDRVVRCAQLVDYVVAPESQSGYLAAGLLRRAHGLAAQDGYALTAGLTNRNSFKVSVHPRVGMVHLFTPALAMKPLRSFAPSAGPLRHLPLRLAARAATWCASATAACFRPARPPSDVAIRAVARFDPDHDRLWERASAALPVAFVRDAAYLEWRYLRQPVYRYHILSACRGAELIGWMVLAERTQQDVRLGLIVDWLTDPAAREAEVWLLGAAHDWGLQQRVDALAAAVIPAMTFAARLRRCGYFTLPERVSPLASRMVVKSLQPDLDRRFEDASQWFWTWGDSDVG